MHGTIRGTTEHSPSGFLTNFGALAKRRSISGIIRYHEAIRFHNASNDRAVRAAIFDKISRSHIVIIPTGMYVNYSKWIQKEIEGAQGYGKPILAVNPWVSYVSRPLSRQPPIRSSARTSNQ